MTEFRMPALLAAVSWLSFVLGQPHAAAADTVSVTPPYEAYGAAGHVRYFSNDMPVPGATLQLSGPQVVTVQTAADGSYGFDDIGGQTWQLAALKQGDAGSGISTLDALYSLQAVVGLRTLTAAQSLACDVTGDGTVSTTDALVILKYLVGFVTRFPVAERCGSDWAFLPVPAPASNQEVTAPLMQPGSCQSGAITFNPLDAPATGQDFSGVLFGDCTGNWLPAVIPTPTATPTATPTRTASALQIPSRTVTGSVTPTRTRTATVTRTAAPTLTRTALPTNTKTVTPTRTQTVTRTPTLTATPGTPTPTSSGPQVVHFGLARADGCAACDADYCYCSTLPTQTPQLDSQNRPVFQQTQGVLFLIVVEARPATTNGPAVGQMLLPADPAERPDLQLEASNPLLPTNATGKNPVACVDCRAPTDSCPNSDPRLWGGVPAVTAPDFEGDQTTTNTMTDFACRFRIAISPDSACTLDSYGNFGFLNPYGTQGVVQFCHRLSGAAVFPLGDTVLTARVRDSSASKNLGPPAQIVVRIVP